MTWRNLRNALLAMFVIFSFFTWSNVLGYRRAKKELGGADPKQMAQFYKELEQFLDKTPICPDIPTENQILGLEIRGKKYEIFGCKWVN